MRKIKLFFKRILWYFEALHYAKNHAKEVDNYRFLVDLRKKAHARFLEMERTEPENPDLVKLKVQIELIDKILKYTNGYNG